MKKETLRTPKSVENKVVNAYNRVEDAVVGIYQNIEDGVVGTYQKIEDGVVNTYQKIEDRFVRVFLSVALMLGLGLTQLHAQGVLGGIKVDANMSNLILSDLDGVKSKLGFGVTAGGYTKLMLGNRLGLQPEILLHYKNSKMELGKIERDFQYFGVEMPLYLAMQAGNCSINLGPYVGFGIDARYKSGSGLPEVELYKEYGGQKSQMQRWDLGAGAMFGYEFNNGLQVTAGYKIGFIDALNAGKDDATMLNQTISVGLGYRFGK